MTNLVPRLTSPGNHGSIARIVFIKYNDIDKLNQYEKRRELFLSEYLLNMASACAICTSDPNTPRNRLDETDDMRVLAVAVFTRIIHAFSIPAKVHVLHALETLRLYARTLLAVGAVSDAPRSMLQSAVV